MTKTLHVDTAAQAFDVLRAENRKQKRQCGDCQLCCKLLPVHDDEPWRGQPLHKPAGVKCPHQKFGVGCKVYGTSAMPFCCKIWQCRWIVNDDTSDLSRPDRSHYVLDIAPDHITMENNETKATTAIQVVQIWIDPKYPDAHRDPALRAYLLRRGEQGIAALVRYDNKRALTIIPPNMVGEGAVPPGWLHPGGWIEIPHDSPNVKAVGEHTLADTIAALGPMKMVIEP